MSILEISCLDVWREISNLIDGGVSPELRQRIEEHLKVCEHCTAIYDGTRNVVKLVADGRTYELPAGFSDRLRRRLEGHVDDKS
jgi:predicted anti-sigma-YlaC factor YlaD